MAIDSPIKRASVVNFGVPWPVVLPVPAGSVGNDDKAMTLNMYAGIAFAAGGIAGVWVTTTPNIISTAAQ